MTTERVNVEERLTEAFAVYSRPVRLWELTATANGPDSHAVFQLGQGAVRACLDRMEKKGLVTVTKSPTGASLFTYNGVKS